MLVIYSNCVAPVFQGGDLCVIMEKGPHKNHCLSDFVQISGFFACNPFKLCGPRFPSTIYKRRWTLEDFVYNRTTGMYSRSHFSLACDPPTEQLATKSRNLQVNGRWFDLWRVFFPDFFFNYAGITIN